MAKAIRGKRASRGYSVAEELKRIQEINGTKRTVSVVVEDVKYLKNNTVKSTAEYGPIVNNEPTYNFSKGTVYLSDKIRDNRKIKKSIKSIGKGKRRSKKELDEISKEMGRVVIDDVHEWISSGMYHIYQHWKDSSDKNLIDTGHLIDAIVCVVKDNKGKEIWRGR